MERLYHYFNSFGTGKVWRGRNTSASMHSAWELCWEKVVSAKGLGDASTALGNRTAPGKQYVLEIHDLNAVASCHCANLQAGSGGTTSRVVPIPGSPPQGLVASHGLCGYVTSVLASR